MKKVHRLELPPKNKPAKLYFTRKCTTKERLTRGVSHGGLAIYIKKYLKAKEQLWKLKSFTMQKYINLQKNPLKETKILQDIITL